MKEEEEPVDERDPKAANDRRLPFSADPAAAPPSDGEPPENPAGGRTLIVDSSDPGAFPRPSAALKEARAEDQVFVRPGLYEDKIFLTHKPVRLIGAGLDQVQIFSRRGGPLYLQHLPEGLISGMTFRYIGSDPHSAINILDSVCTLTRCRIMEGVLSGIVIYGPQCRPTLIENEVCFNRESGIFIFAGARPYLSKNECYANHHFGIAVRDPESRPDLVRNLCRNNMLSGMLMFYHAEAMVLENVCRDNQHWGFVTTPECDTTPDREALPTANTFLPNPRGPLVVTEEPLAEIGR